MTLSATTLLAENTESGLDRICESLRSSGTDIAFDRSLDPGERIALVEAGEIDLVWACGLLTAEMVDRGLPLEVVGVPLLPHESEPVYRSVVVTRPAAGFDSVADALTGRLAVNEYGSWSGWHAYVDHLRRLGRSVGEHPTQVVTGSHVASVRSLLDGVADVASIDSSVWRWLEGVDPGVDSLRALDTTQDWPAPPLSLRSPRDRALATAVGSLEGVWPTGSDAYRTLLELARG